MGEGFDKVSFREIQRFRQASLWGLLGTTAFVVIGVMGCGLFIQLVLGKPWDQNPAPDGVSGIDCRDRNSDHGRGCLADVRCASDH